MRWVLCCQMADEIITHGETRCHRMTMCAAYCAANDHFPLAMLQSAVGPLPTPALKFRLQASNLRMCLHE